MNLYSINREVNNMDITKVTVHFSGRNFLLQNEVNFIMASFNSHTMVSVAVASVYRALPLVESKTRCSQTITTDTCKAECSFRRFRELCNCTPTAFGNVVTTVPHEDYCNVTQYTVCKAYEDAFLTNNLINNTCVDCCLNSCERWRYRFFFSNLEATTKLSYLCTGWLKKDSI